MLRPKLNLVIQDPNSGRARPGALVSIYLANTFSLSPLYADDDVTPVPNPVTAGFNAGKTLDVAAVNVVGHISYQTLGDGTKVSDRKYTRAQWTPDDTSCSRTRARHVGGSNGRPRRCRPDSGEAGVLPDAAPAWLVGTAPGRASAAVKVPAAPAPEDNADVGVPSSGPRASWYERSVRLGAPLPEFRRGAGLQPAWGIALWATRGPARFRARADGVADRAGPGPWARARVRASVLPGRGRSMWAMRAAAGCGTSRGRRISRCGRTSWASRGDARRLADALTSTPRSRATTAGTTQQTTASTRPANAVSGDNDRMLTPHLGSGTGMNKTLKVHSGLPNWIRHQATRRTATGGWKCEVCARAAPRRARGVARDGRS
jgi:hypothetical protein